MSMCFQRSEDGGAAHPHDDAAPHPLGGAGGRHDPRAPGLRRDHLAEDRGRRCRRVGGHDRQDRQEARLLRLQGFPQPASSTTTACRRPSSIRSCRPTTPGAEIAQKVFRTSIHALEETLSILDPEAFESAADLIFTARQRDFYGIGGSAQIARDVAPQVPADRRADQRLRRCAHDADVGGTPWTRATSRSPFPIRGRPPPSSSPWNSPAGAVPAPSR